MLLELLLLQSGIDPVIWQSEYGRYYEDAVLDPEAIRQFQPDLIYIYTGVRNIQNWPRVGDSGSGALNAELARFRQIWDSLRQISQCPIFQNNCELPDLRVLGNLEAGNPAGSVRFVHDLNQRFADESQQRPYLVLNDIHYLSAQIGLNQWYDWSRWFSYKITCSPEGSLAIATNLTRLIGARYGMSRKCLVLDLDNTLWGGVIGDDGPDRIVIGKETALAEAYTQFQQYCVKLKERGIVLAVCSKNNDAVARQGFSHPDSVLKLEDFAAFKANWEPKHENIKAIAADLNLGLDSFVFADDNPAERALVKAQLPMVAVPELGEDVSQYARILDRSHYFETISLSAEDLMRAQQYRANAAAVQTQSTFASYAEYLDSLKMVAEVGSFSPTYLDRITQLTNKTNQFNLTTRRYSAGDIGRIAADDSYLTLYVRLSDKFTDHGLISVVIGRRDERVLHIDLWLMSCRVLKRDLELLVLDELAVQARAAGLQKLYGYYVRTPKNDMVSKHYETLGFHCEAQEHERSTWSLDVTDYQLRNRSIQIADTRRSAGAAAANFS